jgi:3-isopropylmalate/(R)-2-methylmalate dehydratase small subunit
MESFVRVSGLGVPMMRINVDTDQLTPGKELVGKQPPEGGWGAALFSNLRYTDGRRTPNPEFILNQEPWKRGVFLLADRNFGCGSSREMAPWALREFGFRGVIAPSFGGIFFSNCFRNGILPVELPIEEVAELARQTLASAGAKAITVDLEREQVTAPEGDTFGFRSPRMLREMLLKGQDEIALTLSRHEVIKAYRCLDHSKRPWAY